MTVEGSSPMDDEQFLRRALVGLQAATGLPLTFGGRVHNGKQVSLTEFAGPIVGALRGVSLGFGLGLGGRAVALRRPLVVNDYLRATSISHQYDRVIAAEGLRAMTVAPVVVHRESRAVLYGTVRSDVPLGDRVAQAFHDAARDLEQSLAIRDEAGRQAAWLRQQVAQRAESTGPRWELVREAYTQLRVLATRTGKPNLQAELDSICATLEAATAPPGSQSEPPLSPRELDVLALVAIGWTNPDIAHSLDLQRETVKSYLRSAMQKLHSHTRLEAVVTARRHGWLP